MHTWPRNIFSYIIMTSLASSSKGKAPVASGHEDTDSSTSDKSDSADARPYQCIFPGTAKICCKRMGRTAGSAAQRSGYTRPMS